MRLHRENDDVLRARCPIVIGRSHMRHRQFTAIAHDEPNSTGPERIEISPACDESHFIARMREPGSEVPTDRADTNDRYLQCVSSIGRMQLRPSLLNPTARGQDDYSSLATLRETARRNPGARHHGRTSSSEIISGLSPIPWVAQ